MDALNRAEEMKIEPKYFPSFFIAAVGMDTFTLDGEHVLASKDFAKGCLQYDSEVSLLFYL